MKYRDRKGNEFEIDTAQDKFLRNLYTTVWGRCLLKFMTGKKMSDLIGWYMGTRLSTVKIDKFVKKNKINMKEYKRKFYKSYNDFFTRKIKPSARPINMDAHTLISPSDGKATVYPISDRLVVNIKNIDYSIKSLLLDHDLSVALEGGWCYVIRLTTDNYHRYCYPDSGYQYDNYYIPGVFHTVNPVALENTSVFAQNSREYTIIDTEHFGRVIQMEVGAMGVGRISNRYKNRFVKKGHEKGYFEFGGSTIVLLLPKDSVIPDDDILLNTAEGYETIVKMGEGIGYAENKGRS
ncbi:MAG: phosphatidylserine decarboxylase [Lachnospiraceae bacterium]|nr:phosphatidylserine decarboxylase [Lachnospiraceae bacterium]